MEESKPESNPRDYSKNPKWDEDSEENGGFQGGRGRGGFRGGRGSERGLGYKGGRYHSDNYT